MNISLVSNVVYACDVVGGWGVERFGLKWGKEANISLVWNVVFVYDFVSVEGLGRVRSK